MPDELMMINEQIKQKTDLSLLASMKDVTIPQKAFSAGKWNMSVNPMIFYISDIHLDRHLSDNNLFDYLSQTEYIDKIVNNLIKKHDLSSKKSSSLNDIFQTGNWEALSVLWKMDDLEATEKYNNLSENQKNEPILPFLQKCVVFTGDLSDSIELNELFFRRLLLQLNERKNDFEIKNICPIYYILGNHEYSEFDSVEETQIAYRNMLNKYDVKLLQNEYLEFSNCYVLGGTAFAKYNDRYNASTIVGPQSWMKDPEKARTFECEETNKFLDIYREILKKAIDNNKPLILFAHYPVKDWLDFGTSNRCFYFTGHNHNNKIEITDNGEFYANNQIGYTGKIIHFKSVQIGTIYNPFIDFQDGIHVITLKQYQDFYMYNGEYVGTGLIERAINKGEVLYLIKHNGFYGFFVIGKKNTRICAGGALRVISEITSIEYFDNCFSLMISVFIKGLLPFRQLQEQISKEVKALHTDPYCGGNIHGCIVDVDFTHHIMINPYDGKITFYYSPIYGIVQEFESFTKLLESMKEKSGHISKKARELIEGKCDITLKKKMLLSTGNSNFSSELQKIDVGESLYIVSRKMNQLQRLFTSNILRDWNNDFINQLLGIDVEMKALQGTSKELTPYKLVQQSWMNITRINPKDINGSVMEEFLKPNRRIPFPYKNAKKRKNYYLPIDPMDINEIQKYIKFIPEKYLIVYLKDFIYLLGTIKLLRVYPLEILGNAEFDIIFNGLNGQNKTIIEGVAEIPFEDWTDSFGKHVCESITVKNRPNYCSKELWNKIKFYK